MFLLQARQAPVAVIFRRGPSKWVELIRWETTSDTVERGHWFHGRIYQRRCDLSPDGSKLIYFASKFTGATVQDKEYTYAWTAISKPPWLTALALWPKGDCWHGGGLFRDDRTVWLNHQPEQATPHPSHLPKGLQVVPNPGAHGEDDPIYSERLTRDGWELRQAWDYEYSYESKGFRTNTPEVRVRRHPSEPALGLRMERYLRGYRYSEMFRLDGAELHREVRLAGADAADWDHRGRLAVLHQGRLMTAELNRDRMERPRLIADFTADRPAELEAPASAKTW
jgi:hypothetical protein